jgi:hypothetical protein
VNSGVDDPVLPLKSQSFSRGNAQRLHPKMLAEIRKVRPIVAWTAVVESQRNDRGSRVGAGIKNRSREKIARVDAPPAKNGNLLYAGCLAGHGCQKLRTKRMGEIASPEIQLGLHVDETLRYLHSTPSIGFQGRVGV